MVVAAARPSVVPRTWRGRNTVRRALDGGMNLTDHAPTLAHTRSWAIESPTHLAAGGRMWLIRARKWG